ncbi:hypothetical protein MOQ_003075 [Trypanosoma cruzi marinkellei]|uniref:Uncharacterized protein n=1 Tax=Trypanosoma cruzi marinkellei TaxID=85056 RepID=K2NVV4_TRYCR|nr:hypothetical protein MOQ_003075 [Trypanosoma cruzi marinkellei]
MACKRSSTFSMPFRAGDGIETASVFFHEEPPSMPHDGGTAFLQGFPGEGSGESVRLADTQCSYCCRGSDGWRCAKKEATHLPLLRLEQQRGLAAMRLLEQTRQHHSPNGRWQSHFEPLTGISDFIADRSVEEWGDSDNGDDPVLNISPAIPLALSTRPPSVDVQGAAQQQENALHELDESYPEMLENKTRMAIMSPRADSCEEGLGALRRCRLDDLAERMEEGVEHLLCEDGGSFGDASPPLYIFVAPPSAAAEEDASAWHREASPGEHTEINVKGEAQGHDGKCEGNPIEYSGTRNLGLLRSQPPSSPSPWKVELQGTPSSKWRANSLPPQTLSERFRTHLKEKSFSVDATWKSATAHKYRQLHLLCTPSTKNIFLDVGSPCRPKTAVIGSWRSLSSHCKRAGLKTPEVPLLLKESGYGLFDS